MNNPSGFSHSIHAVRLAVAAFAVLLAPSANADYKTGYSIIGGSECQPTAEAAGTEFRARAIGARNESETESRFVVCPVQASPSNSEDPITEIVLMLYSIDGVSHQVSCTATSGWKGSGLVAYSTKTAAVSSTATNDIGQDMGWSAFDFGGTSGFGIRGSLQFSVTCLLPPKTAISLIQESFLYDAGQ